MKPPAIDNLLVATTAFDGPTLAGDFARRGGFFME